MPVSDFIATIEANGPDLFRLGNLCALSVSTVTFRFSSSRQPRGAYGTNFSQLVLVPGVTCPPLIWAAFQVINGFVTNRSVSYDAKSHQVVIAGKSKIEHLRKSSVVVKAGKPTTDIRSNRLRAP